jgi:geranylgeranyl diphosphate synthase type II
VNFDLYKDRFEQQLRLSIEKMGEKSPLRDACSYSLTTGGKRLRPFLVLMIADALGSCDAMPSALSVEFFHTASLIADDLPCMDNDSMRRGVPSLHVAFGESTAVLASLTLIAAGYGGIYENGKLMKENPCFAASADARAMACLEAATRCAGIQGATQGQFLDLFPAKPSVETIREIIYKKTVTLFEISFLFGWIFGGGDLQKIPLLKKCAYHLGYAFQIADDLEDRIQDAALGRGVNMAFALGKKKAISCFKEEIALLEETLKVLHLWTHSFQELIERLVARQSLCLGSFL